MDGLKLVYAINSRSELPPAFLRYIYPIERDTELQYSGFMPVDTVDFALPEAVIHIPKKYSSRHPFWTDFSNDMTEKIFKRGGTILDIGGGLRIVPKGGFKIDAAREKKFAKYLTDPSVRFIVSDYTDQYGPDVVEDIHRLTGKDNSLDGIFCMAVLEHVYDPKKAAEEIVRVLKKGGEAFLYVPFMYRYHANTTEDYKDYYRYSKDGIAYLFRDCEKITICPVRGLFESLLRFTPLHNVPFLATLLRSLDWSTNRMKRISERQSSGYFIHLVK